MRASQFLLPLIFGGVAILPVAGVAQDSWSAPRLLAGTSPTAAPGSSNFGAVVDLNGNLELPTTTNTFTNATPQFQYLNPDESVSAPEDYPLFPGFSDHRGRPGRSAFSPNGDRIVQWYSLNGGASLMRYRSALGIWGPNIINMGIDPAAIAFRNDLVIALSIGSNGVVEVREWSVAPDGTLSARPSIPILIDETTGGCGAAIGINDDSSAVAIFKVGLGIRTARRTAVGVWSLDLVPMDSVDLNVQSLGCAYAASSPLGRIITAWWKRGVGSGENADRGGEIRALVREPNTDFPAQASIFHSATVDLSGNRTRRDYGVNVAMGLDGTAGVVAYTEYCSIGGPGKIFISIALLRIAGPQENFALAPNLTVPETSSGTNKIYGMLGNHIAVPAFAVENRRALVAAVTAAYPQIGTSNSPTCGPGGSVTVPITIQSTATLFDRNNDQSFSLQIGSVVRQAGQPNIQGLFPYEPPVAAALDFNGNAAIVRGGTTLAPSDLILLGDWQSNGGSFGSQPPPSGDLCPSDPSKTLPGICGCGAPELDSNKDGKIDCGSPTPFSNRARPALVSARRTGKGKASLSFEKLAGSGLSYELTVTGPKRFKRIIMGRSPRFNISKLPAGALKFRVRVIQKPKRGKPISSRTSATVTVQI